MRSTIQPTDEPVQIFSTLAPVYLEFVHSISGVRTLEDQFDKTASHNEHHLGQIRGALNLTTKMNAAL